jgi:hypothetical protein
MKTTLTLLLTGCIINVATSYAQTNTSSEIRRLIRHTAWLLRGNSGTDTAINFIGTKDKMPVLFKVNNQKAGYLDDFGTTVFGYQASLPPSNYSGNTAIGYRALHSNIGGDNTAVGYDALHSNREGSYNSAYGVEALSQNTTGSVNLAVGQQALYSNTKGVDNLAVGYGTLSDNTTGGENTAVGHLALWQNTTGSNNTAFGEYALEFPSGNNNTAVGYQAFYFHAGKNNTAVGAGAGAPVDAVSGPLFNSTVIGAGALVDASNEVRIGNHSVTSIGGQVGWSQFSDERVKQDVKENVPGLEFIRALRPVTYHFSVSKEEELLGVKEMKNYSADIANAIVKGVAKVGVQGMPLPNPNMVPNATKEIGAPQNKYDIEKTQFTGLIAQEVDAAAKKLSYDFSGVDKTGKIWGLRYGDFVVPLIKAVQELSQQNDEKDKKIEELESRLARVESLIAQYKPQQSQDVALGTAARLEQNVPNPFTGSTSIAYCLPANKGNAYINFYASNGAFLKSVKLSGVGNGTINIKANELSSGAYRYSLMIDGKVVDSKQMVQAK